MYIYIYILYIYIFTHTLIHVTQDGNQYITNLDEMHREH